MNNICKALLGSCLFLAVIVPAYAAPGAPTVPEPGSITLLVVGGLSCAGILLRNRRNK